MAAAAAAAPAAKGKEAELYAAIMGECNKHPTGITCDALITTLCANYDGPEIMNAMNILVAKAKLEYVGTKGGPPTVRPVVGDPKFVGLTEMDRLVYQIIEKTGNMGIWIRDIRMQSGLDLKTANKTLKVLESRRLIKAVNSVVAAKKKVYMLFHLEPDESLTGGQFYSGQEMDTEFTSILTQLSHGYLQMKATKAQQMYGQDPMMRLKQSTVSAAELLDYLDQKKASNVPLAVRDAATVLEILVHDGKAEIRLTGGEKTYVLVRQPLVSADVLCAPCGVCPVFHNCSEGSVVSPSACIYLKDWMEF